MLSLLAWLSAVPDSGRLFGCLQEPTDDGLLRLIDEDAALEPFSGRSLPRTAAQLGDATLLDLSLVGRFWVAVGERGTVCISQDAGNTWTTQAVPFECRLSSVCFLTNRVGWIGGRRPAAGRPGGAAVLLATRDGGTTWRDMTADAGTAIAVNSIAGLPGIEQIQFFGLDEALAICTPDAAFGGQTVFRSQDGGLTWESLQADQSAAPWLAMACLGADAAVLGGLRQQTGALVSGEVVMLEEPRRTLRSIRGISMDADGRGWLGGDGGVLLGTEDAGVSWSPPAGEFPEGVSDIFDIRTIIHQGTTIMVGGFPGATLLRSDDGGHAWEVCKLPVSGVLHRLRWQGEQTVAGVGSFGVILRSEDGGSTWECVRGAGRHCGLLNLVTSAKSASWELLAAECLEQGLRTAVYQPAVELAELAQEPERRQSHTAVRGSLMQLAAAELESDWMFPREQGLQHYSREALLAGWNRQTDGRVSELLPLRLARALCAFRPLAVVVEPMNDDDEASHLFLEALPRALQLAENPGGTPLESAGLDAWRPLRVVRRLPQGQRAALNYTRDELLEGSGTTIGLACLAARADNGWSIAAGTPAYGSWPEDAEAVDRLMGGLERQLTSAVRRPPLRRSREQLEELRTLVRRGRLESAAMGGHAALQNAEEAFVANLESAGVDLPAGLAEQQLLELAALCRERNNADGYLAVQQELVRRFPDSESAWRAASELLLMYSSMEVRHYRMKSGGTGPSSRQTPANALQEVSPDIPGASPETFSSGETVLRPRIEPGTGVSFGGSGGSQLAAVHENWDGQAQTAWRLLQRHAEGGTGERKSVPTAAALRWGVTLARRQRNGEAANVLAGLARQPDRMGLWAQSEYQQLQGMRSTVVPTLNIARSGQRPLLDGRLSDGIWEDADELALEPVSAESAAGASGEALRSLTMLAWDDEFLYVAARLERRPGTALLQTAAERHYDEPHGDRDRLELSVDTDRDLLTAFRMTVDETGRTDDACTELTRWNPQWYVAVDSDELAWRVELAIPFAELSSEPVRPGTLWSIRLRRLSPAEPEQLLRPLAAENNDLAEADLGGAILVRFIRPQPATR